MTELCNINFENGALYERPSVTAFDTILTCGPKLEVLAAAAHSGSFGLSVTPVSNSYLFGYGYHAIAKGSAQYRFRMRFYLHPNSISMSTMSQGLRISRQASIEYPWAGYTIWLSWGGSSYDISFRGFNGSHDEVSMGTSSNYNISNAWHRIEMAYIAAVSGSVQVWVDGISIGTISGDNRNAAISAPSFGVCFPATTGIVTSGSFYMDDIIITDDPNTEIGA